MRADGKKRGQTLLAVDPCAISCSAALSALGHRKAISCVQPSLRRKLRSRLLVSRDERAIAHKSCVLSHARRRRRPQTDKLPGADSRTSILRCSVSPQPTCLVDLVSRALLNANASPLSGGRATTVDCIKMDTRSHQCCALCGQFSKQTTAIRLPRTIFVASRLLLQFYSSARSRFPGVLFTCSKLLPNRDLRRNPTMLAGNCSCLCARRYLRLALLGNALRAATFHPLELPFAAHRVGYTARIQ